MLNTKLIPYLVLVGMLLLSTSSFVNSNSSINTFADLFLNVQHLAGYLGVIGSVIIAWISRSPTSGINSGDGGFLSRLTGSGDIKLPPTSGTGGDGKDH